LAATLDDLLTVLEDQSKRFANIEDLQKRATEAAQKGGASRQYEKEQEIIRKRIAEEERLTRLLKERKIDQNVYDKGLARAATEFEAAASSIGIAATTGLDALKDRFKADSDYAKLLEKSLYKVSGFTFAMDLGKLALTSYTKTLGTMQSSSTGVSGALELAKGTVNTIGDALKFLGDNALIASLGLSELGPEAVAVGAGLGKFTGAAGDALKFFANDIMPILNRNIENMSKGFHEAASAGALFTGGITELRESAHAAGLGTEDFAKGLKEFSSDFVALGGDVTNGGRRFVAITQQMSKNLGGDYRNSFLQLGYSINEIPGIIAKVGAEASRAVGGASNQQVAQAVQDYAKNLRLIADLTGQDAKTLQQKADAEFKDLKFREFLNKNVPAEQRAAVKNMLAALPADELELVKSRIVGFGNISDSVAGIIADQIPAYAQSSQQIFQLLASGRSSVQAIADIDQGASKAAAQQKSNLDDFATGAIKAGGDIAAAAAKIADGFDQTLATANRTEADYERAKADNLAAATANLGDETNKILAIEKQTTDAFIAQENATSAALNDYALMVQNLNELQIDLINSTGDLIKKFDDLAGGKIDKSLAKGVGSIAGGVAGASGGLFAGAETGAAIGAGVGAIFPPAEALTVPIGAAIGAAAGAWLGDAAGSNLGSSIAESLTNWWNKTTGQAEGGLLSGPDSGFLAKLHGNEAVIPLPTAMSSEELPEFLSAAVNNSNNSKNDEVYKMIDNSISTPMNQQTDLMQTLISKVDQLIDATKDVATYTERTSMRVA